MFDLAQHSNGEPISLSVISKRQKLPLNYLEQIMLKLKKANLVISVRGAYGGYKLNRNTDEISVKDIFDVLEGPISLAECFVESKCGKSNYCITRLIYKEMSDKLNETIENITLEDMIKDKNEMMINDILTDL